MKYNADIKNTIVPFKKCATEEESLNMLTKFVCVIVKYSQEVKTTTAHHSEHTIPQKNIPL